MAQSKFPGPSPCSVIRVKDLYAAVIDIERRIHVIRTLLGRFDPSATLTAVEHGSADEVKPRPDVELIGRVICASCHPVDWSGLK